MIRTTIVTTFLLLAGCASTRTPAAQPGSAADEVPAWLRPADACPADVVAAVEVPTGRIAGVCEADLDGCMRLCQGRDPTACYASGLRAEELASRRLSEALFLRACQLGSSIGCTNRAAGLLTLDGERPGAKICAARTFAITCERRDPWGCTMYGASLASGEGVPQDLERALEVLPGGCSLGPDDPACQAAQALIAKIEASRPAPR